MQLKQYFITQEMRGTNKETVCDNEKEGKSQPHDLTSLPKLTRLIALTSCLSIPHVLGGLGPFSNSQKRMPTKVKAETSRVHLLGICI